MISERAFPYDRPVVFDVVFLRLKKIIAATRDF